MYCPKCQAEVSTVVQEMTESYPVKGEPVLVEAQVRICSVCGEEVWDDVLDSQNLRRAYAQYRKTHGLLQPEEIQEIRELYGLSQVVFARILGLGDKTVARYENGSLADAAQNNLIALARDPENFRQLLEMSRCRITDQDYETARKALEQVSRQVSYNPKQIYVIREDADISFKLNWGDQKYA